MIMEKIVQSLTIYYNRFLPVWKWTVPVEPKTAKHKHVDYEKVISMCRSSQYILGVLVLGMAILFERPRQLFVYAAFRKGLPMLLLDLFTSIFVAYLLGFKRLPANCISLWIIRFFVLLEEKMKPPAHLDVKLLGHSGFNGMWTLITASPKVAPTVPGSLSSQVIRNAVIAVVCFITFGVVNKFKRVDVSKYKKSLLIAQTIATSLAAILLVSTFAFDAIPEFKETHRKLCEIWTIFAVATVVSAAAFLFIHLQTPPKRKDKRTSDINLRVEWDTLIFVVAFSIVARYLPVVHKGFSVPSVLSNGNTIMLEWIVPGKVLQIVFALIANFDTMGEEIAKMKWI